MSVLEQVLALGQQLTPEERAEVSRTWRAQELLPAPQLSPETERILDEALARYRRGEKSYTSEEVHAAIRARLQP